ncbi:MAG: hypothetical protein ACI9UJ_000089 [bacterium]|jgi:hypothetical protein
MQKMSDKEENIEKYIKSKARGTLLFPEDFMSYGTSVAIRKSLQRIKEKGIIRRVAHGIYVRPKINQLIGEILPTTEEVAKGIAKRDKIKIVPTGTYALYALGLSTQIPLNLVFLTDGAPRIIKVGKRTIKLKKTTPKNLMAKGKISGLAIQALREIGKGKVSEDELSQIMKILEKEDILLLIHDSTLAPEWIRQILKKAINE